MEISPLFSGMNASTSGMTAQRKRMNAIAENLANAETTRTAEGGPYQRKQVAFSEQISHELSEQETIHNKLARDDAFHLPGKDSAVPRTDMSGVKAEISQSVDDFRLIYDPEHPDADDEGMVKMPNVDIVQEMTDLIAASRAFEANVTAFNATKAMMKKAMDL